MHLMPPLAQTPIDQVPHLPILLVSLHSWDRKEQAIAKVARPASEVWLHAQPWHPCPHQYIRPAAHPKEETETPLQPGHKGTQDEMAGGPFGVQPTQKYRGVRL